MATAEAVMESDGMVDTTSDAALKSLADIALPPPVSYMPQTWGWAALAIVVLLAIAVLLWLWLRRWQANRYRREALAELDALVAPAVGPAGSVDFQMKLAEIVKRTALAAWPRETVASLSGAGWAQFLGEHGPEKHKTEALIRLVNDREYAATPVPPDEQAALVAAIRQWIEKHHVSA
jgi:hypothetical protein